MDLLSVASGVGHQAVSLSAEAEPLFQINLFQVLIGAANFVIFLAIIWKFAFNPVAKILSDRKERIEQGLKDAEQARLEIDSPRLTLARNTGLGRRSRPGLASWT